MSSINGLPLLSGPAPQSEASEACRKCNKEFNLIFTRSRKCNHCGYSYCQPCSDYQALMPRAGPDSGYDSMNVCAYCIELLSITAAGVSQLRSMSPGKLKTYADAYNIDISRAVEKLDIIDAIVRARQPSGCLPRAKEDYYRRCKVPNPYAGSRPRGLFSRNNVNPPPVSPRTRPEAAPSFPRPDLGQDHPPPPPPPPRPHSAYPQPQAQPPPRAQYQYPPHSAPPPPPPPPPQSNYGHSRPTYQYGPNYHQQQHYNAPPYHPSFNQSHPPPPPPQETRPSPSSYPQPNAYHRPPTQQPPPPPSSTRPRTTSTPNQSQAPTPPPAVPMPTLDQLLVMTQHNVATLPISVLKSILFTNHVNASMILEKSELVKKVLELIEDEKRERERQRMVEEAERIEEEERRREREESIKREEEERRLREEDRVRQERRERYRATMEEVDDDESDDVQEYEVEVESDSSKSDANNRDGRQPNVPTPDSSSSLGTPPKPSSSSTYSAQKSFMTSSLERSGLCVICQDEEANIAIVDCGHMAMCRACSELVMSSSRECPLCRTRIVTEARLLRIFKS